MRFLKIYLHHTQKNNCSVCGEVESDTTAFLQCLINMLTILKPVVCKVFNKISNNNERLLLPLARRYIVHCSLPSLSTYLSVTDALNRPCLWSWWEVQYEFIQTSTGVGLR